MRVHDHGHSSFLLCWWLIVNRSELECKSGYDGFCLVDAKSNIKIPISHYWVIITSKFKKTSTFLIGVVITRWTTIISSTFSWLLANFPISLNNYVYLVDNVLKLHVTFLDFFIMVSNWSAYIDVDSISMVNLAWCY